MSISFEDFPVVHVWLLEGYHHTIIPCYLMIVYNNMCIYTYIHDYPMIIILLLSYSHFICHSKSSKKLSPTSHAFPTGRKAPGWRTTRWPRFWRRSTRRSFAWNPRPSSAPPRAAPTWPFGCPDSDLPGGNVESLSMFICYIYTYFIYIYILYIYIYILYIYIHTLYIYTYFIYDHVLHWLTCMEIHEQWCWFLILGRFKYP